MRPVHRRQRIDGARVEGFTIKGFDRNGVFMLCVDHWLIDDEGRRPTG